MKLVKIALIAALAVAPAALFAQTTTPPPTVSTVPVTPVTGKTIAQRKVNQQDRIAQGVKSGSLTPGETSKLEHQEAGINKEEHGMREEDNGKLSKADKKLLNHQQNQESRRIHRDKHNTRTR